MEMLINTLVQLLFSVYAQVLLLRAYMHVRTAHLLEMVPHQVLASHMRSADAAVWRLVRQLCWTFCQGW